MLRSRVCYQKTRWEAVQMTFRPPHQEPKFMWIPGTFMSSQNCCLIYTSHSSTQTKRNRTKTRRCYLKTHKELSKRASCWSVNILATTTDLCLKFAEGIVEHSYLNSFIFILGLITFIDIRPTYLHDLLPESILAWCHLSESDSLRLA